MSGIVINFGSIQAEDPHLAPRHRDGTDAVGGIVLIAVVQRVPRRGVVDRRGVNVLAGRQNEVAVQERRARQTELRRLQRLPGRDRPLHALGRVSEHVQVREILRVLHVHGDQELIAGTLKEHRRRRKPGRP